MSTINSWNNSVTAANVTFNGGTMSMGTDSTDNAINIGTASNTGRAVTVGNTTAASVLALKFGTGDFTLASATGTIISILDTGEMTEPLQSAFLGVLPSTVTNCTGDSTLFTLGTTTALTEVFDQNGDFNTNGTFTAPITARYNFFGNITYECNATNGGTQYTIALSTSNAFVYDILLPTRKKASIGNFYGPSGYLPGFGTLLCDMDAADIATFTVSADSGSKTDSVIGHASIAYSYFSGYLVA